MQVKYVVTFFVHMVCLLNGGVVAPDSIDVDSHPVGDALFLKQLYMYGVFSKLEGVILPQVVVSV